LKGIAIEMGKKKGRMSGSSEILSESSEIYQETA
jgi:hypothetical protein